MDWSKAKNILIIAFILTNIFLFYHVGKGLLVGGELDLVSNEYILNVERHLNEKGIYVSGEIPREIISLPKVRVKYKIYDHEETAELFLGKDYYKVSEGTYGSQHQQLIIEGNKKIRYYNASRTKVMDKISEVKAQEISNEFLKEKGFLTEDVHLKQIFYQSGPELEQDSMTYKLVYHQVFKKRFLGESYINVYVNHDGVVGFESMLLEIEGNDSQQKNLLIHATEALLKKMNEIINDNQDKIVIRNIEVGYYINPYDLTDWQSIESGDAVPAWKITLENGKVYYVEALEN
ncbi:two-component system regulatory protein YycI [Alkaliphilus hydrothermalis]|uniref:Regulatory protein YycI of two-component signal transduction system YycFG n=1 Tax=Alkaliphilus hydrothermalis TaxID=1482730 RepID=A0ABS2NRE9_9FIRM|nr:two-component system regulatory protein YycI [Alkaliphilus hydrothermalis]MBM7615540.1 regulatory protein YycI of two-component signal transduction system YycFG [Alkaliphilus hydrothermalis]